MAFDSLKGHPTTVPTLAGRTRIDGPVLVAGLCFACGLPTLLAYNLPPSPTALNQAAAIGAWGMAMLVLAVQCQEQQRLRNVLAATWAPQAALAAVSAAALLSGAWGHLPLALSSSAAAVAVMAGLTIGAGAAVRPSTTLWTGLFAAFLLAGIASLLIGLAQVFAPDASGSQWIARSSIAGRAVGNLRQPNHLSTLLLWSAVAAVPLLEAQALRRHVAARLTLYALFALMLFGVVLSGSRTGLVGVAGLVAWGLFDSRLSRSSRGLLLASPLICLASWMALGWLSSMFNTGALGVGVRIGESQDYSSGRWSIWRDTLTLIAQNPWFGVGFGEFNFAWTLTPFASRNPQFFDHTHNLPLHLAAELGIPLALLVLGLLAWGLWQAFERSAAVDGPQGVGRRAAFVMVLLMALHSQLEYPLWYAYFLLPTAFAWGLCLGGEEAPRQPSSPWMAMTGAVLMLAAAVTVWDYRKVVAIFSPPIDSTATLAERIVEGRHSWFFAHHADYALVTTLDGAGTLPGVFERSTHFLLDTRLMIAWANGLAAQGDVERARHLAARLREFRNPGSKEFFAPCDDPAVAEKPFQCMPPSRAFTWRDFR
jgi:O-Antigen ligase/Virulence factor membrane-bound polymerase, C-terminal/Protein glycosylation ligase